MAIVTRLTYDDLESIPREHDSDRHELIDGELVVTPSSIPAHQIISANIEYALMHHVREHGLGIVIDAPIDIRLTQETCSFPTSSSLRSTGSISSARKPSTPLPISSWKFSRREHGATISIPNERSTLASACWHWLATNSSQYRVEKLVRSRRACCRGSHSH